MFQFLAAAKVGAVLSESIKSIAAITSKEAIARGVKLSFDAAGSKHPGDFFAEKSLLADAVVALQLDKLEIQDLTTVLNSEMFLSVVRSVPAMTASLGTSQLAPLIFQQLHGTLPQKPGELLLNLSERLAAALIATATAGWVNAQSLGLVFPDRAVASNTQSIISAEVASIATRLSEGYQFTPRQLVEFALFEARYRTAVGNHYSKLKPETLGEVKEIPIDSIYVSSDALPYNSTKRDPISREAFLASSFRGVMLGNPGGGKSTFAKKLCYDLSVRFDECIYGSRKLTPVMVVLREYAKYRKLNPCSILEFVNLRCKAELQFDPLENGIKYLFVTGRALVIFDGLDELLDTADRYDIKLAVERFVDQYQAVPVFVTSREVGYEQAPLDPAKFEVHRLAPFNDEQVAIYAKNWFSINADPVLDLDNQRADAFVRDSALVPDLRQNPLILSLLCSLYKQDGYLPSNRPEVYKRCADLLFDKWDKFRGILVSLPIEKKLRPAMAHLAHWIYADETLRAGVSEKALVRETSSYLAQWCADADEALDTAQQFVSFFNGRAWVFRDTGSNKSQPLYGFTHNTFLEFFTAEHLVKNHGTAQSLRDYLLPRLLSREWDVVCQLAYQMYSEMRNAADELTLQLIEAAGNQPLPERLNLASFLARSLDYIFPSRVSRISAIAFCLEMVVETITTPSSEATKSLAAEALGALASCGPDMLPLHTSEVREKLVGYIRGDTPEKTKVEILLIVDQLDEIMGEIGLPFQRHGPGIWTKIQGEIIQETLCERRSLFANYEDLAKSSWWVGTTAVTEIAETHGLGALLRSGPSSLMAWSRVEIAGFLQYLALAGEMTEYRRAECRYIRDQIIKSGRHPDELLRDSTGPTFWGWRVEVERSIPEEDVRDFVLLMATSLRYEGIPTNGELFSVITEVREAKRDGSQIPSALASLEKGPFSAEARKIIGTWLTQSRDANLGEDDDLPSNL